MKKALAVLLVLAALTGLTACSGGLKMQNEIFRSEVGGYTFQVPEGYDHEEDTGFASITPPDYDQATGPGLILMSGEIAEDMTVEELLTQTITSSLDATFTDPVDVKVGGIKGLSIDFSMTTDGVDSNGRIVAVVVSPNRAFMLFGTSTNEKWEGHSKVINQVMKSITFFEPVAATTTQ
mgnify:FL=1